MWRGNCAVQSPASLLLGSSNRSADATPTKNEHLKRMQQTDRQTDRRTDGQETRGPAADYLASMVLLRTTPVSPQPWRRTQEAVHDRMREAGVCLGHRCRHCRLGALECVVVD